MSHLQIHLAKTYLKDKSYFDRLSFAKLIKFYNLHKRELVINLASQNTDYKAMTLFEVIAYGSHLAIINIKESNV